MSMPHTFPPGGIFDGGACDRSQRAAGGPASASRPAHGRGRSARSICAPPP